MRFHIAFLPLILLLAGCSADKPADPEFKGSVTPVPEIAAELIGSDPSWGNTEGPAIDSKGTLYFTSRGSYKGIVSWTQNDGAKPYLAIATKEGPGGLWIDDADNIHLTATGERQMLKVSPDKKVTVTAKNFDVMPSGVSKGPNDLVVLPDGTIYFTAPNGYDGSAPHGTIYRIAPGGKATLFSKEVTGPNGIIASPDKKTLYVSHNTAPNTSKIVSWAIDASGTPGPMRQIATVEPCVADGMDVDTSGSLWLTCYSHGTAYRLSPEGTILEKITTAQKALTNIKFGRGADNHSVYLTSSDMDRATGYVYRARVSTPGTR